MSRKRLGFKPDTKQQFLTSQNKFDCEMMKINFNSVQQASLLQPEVGLLTYKSLLRWYTHKLGMCMSVN